ncbi:MAG: DUF2500 domain-containing protein [Clostridiales bacterium]|nr:DUF2500 domain-containing protein [Clostridiales bacterium]
MTRGFVRRLLAGLGVMAAGVLLLVFVYRPEMLPGVRMLLAGVFAACVFGGLFGILSGWRGFACGACSGVGLAMMYANQALKQPVGGLITIAGLLFAIGAPAVISTPGGIRALFSKWKKGASERSRRRVKLHAAKPKEEVGELLLRSGLWISQYLREGDQIYVARVMAITDESSAKPLLKSAADYAPAKGNSILNVADIADVQRRMGTDGEYVRVRRHSGRPMPWCELVSGDGAKADAQLAKVFAGIPVEWKAGKTPKKASKKIFSPGVSAKQWRTYTEEVRKILRRYDRLRGWLLAASIACQLLWLFVGINYRVLCAANLILPPVSFLLYFYRMRAGVTGNKNADQTLLMDAVLLPNIALGLRMLLDFDLDNWLQLLAPTGAITALFALLALLITRGSGAPRRWMAGALACIALLYALAASVHLNWVLDGGQNRVETVAPIVKMYVSRGGKSPTRYTLTLNTENGEKSVKVGKEFYNTLQVGDEVKLVTSTGPLGITYHYAREAGS